MSTPTSLIGTSPYPGLRPFRSDETGVFFGREEQVDELLARLDRYRFLAVVGPSGCGKSSLVRAGMIPALETGFLAQAGVHWRVATMRPGDRPLRRLAEALLAESALAPERGRESETVAFLHATLRRGPLGMVDVWRETPLPESTNLLLLVDQFEEIFRYRQQGDSDEADAFVALLLATAAQRQVPVYVVITMRSDFFGDCGVFRGLPEAINAGQFLTPRLTRDQCEAAIANPAMVFGGKVEPALVNRLLNDMGEEADQLPLMQHVLMRMWTHASAAMPAYENASEPAGAATGTAAHAAGVTLTLEAYNRIGGLDHALSNHADEAFVELDAEQQRIAEVLFRCLSERSSEQRDTRRPVRLETVAAVAGVSPAHVATVVERFRRADRSFIMPSAEVALQPETILDISHESLIRQWQRLDQWAETETTSAETYRHLEQTARLWQRGQAALWGTPDLENALRWKAQERPTSAWAERYGHDFALAMAFLDASERQREEEHQREEAARQSKLRQVRRQLAMALIGLGIAVGLVLWVSLERQRAEEARGVAETALLETQQARTEAERARVHAEQLAQSEATARDEADKRRAETERLRLAAIVQALVAQPLRIQDDRGALLARQAYLLNERGQGRALDQIDAALRAVLNAPYFSHTLHMQGTLGLSDDRQKLAAVDHDGTIRLWELQQLNAAPTVLRGPAGLAQKALSPDGQTLATFSFDPKRLDPEGFGEVLLWDLRQPQAAPTVLGYNEERFMSLKFSPDGQTLAAGVIDFQRWQRTRRFESRVILWDVRQPDTPPAVLDMPGGIVRIMAFSPDSQTLATISAALSLMASGGGYAGTLRLWDLRQPGGDPTVLGSAEEVIVAVEFSPDGRTLATRHAELPKLSTFGMDVQKMGTQSLGHTIQLWDLQQREANPVVLRSPEAPFSSMAYSPDGQTLATGSSIGSARLWDLRQPHTAPTVLGAHDSQVGLLVFSPDGNTLISQGEANILRVWELRQPTPTFTVLRGHTGAVSSIAFSPEGNTLVSGGKDKTVRLWNLRQPDTPSTVLSDYKAPILSVAFSPDSQWFATGGFMDAQAMEKPSAGDTLWLWSPHQPDATATILAGPGGPVGSVAFSPDSQQLAAAILLDFAKMDAGHRSGSVQLWNPRQPEADPIVLDIPENIVVSVAFSPDGQRLATNSMGGPVRLWDIQQREVVFEFPGDPQNAILSVAFSPDGQRLATSSSNGTVRLWDLRQPEAAPMVFPGGGVSVYAVAFSPDSRWLATGSFSGVARLWDLRQPEAAPIVLRGHEGPVFSVAFSPDGTWLATGSDDQTIRLWEVRTAVLADRVCERVWRNLTLDEWRQFVAADFPYERTCPNLPMHPSVLAEGEKRAKAGDVDGAVAFLQQSQARNPDAGLDPQRQIARVLVAHGKELAASGDQEGATSHFRQARELDPQVDLDPKTMQEATLPPL